MQWIHKKSIFYSQQNIEHRFDASSTSQNSWDSDVDVCVASPRHVCKHLGTEDPTARLVGEECPILPLLLFGLFFFSICAKCFQLVKGLDCKQPSTAPSLFYYRVMLL